MEYSTLDETTPLAASDGMAGFDALDASNTATMVVPAFFDAGGEQPTTANFEANKREARRSSPRARKTERVVCGIALGVSMVSNIGFLVTGSIYFGIQAATNAQNAGASSQTGGSSAGKFNGTCPFGDELIYGPPNVTVVEVGAETLSICWTAHKHNKRVNSHAYELQSDDWFSNDTSLSPIYIGDFRGVTLSSLLPATEYTFRLISHSGDLYALDGPGPQLSETITVTTLESPACGNKNDLTVFQTNGLGMGEEVQSCYIKNIIAGEAAAVACIVEEVHLTEGCSTCWYDFSGCAVSKVRVPGPRSSVSLSFSRPLTTSLPSLPPRSASARASTPLRPTASSALH